MESSVVDYKRLKRVTLPKDDKFNLNHLCLAIGALLFVIIFKRVKDKKSYEQL